MFAAPDGEPTVAFCASLGGSVGLGYDAAAKVQA